MILATGAPTWATTIWSSMALAWASVGTGLSAVASFAPAQLDNFFQAMIQVFFSDLLDQIIVFIFDPRTIVLLSIAFIGKVLGLASAMMPAALANTVAGFAAYLSSPPIIGLVTVGLWLVSAVVDPSIVVYSLYTWFAMWVLCAVLRGVMWLKELIWPGA